MTAETTPTANEAILRKVRALLERAEHTKTPPAEAEAAFAKAAALMHQYGIDDAMAQHGKVGTEDVTKRVIKVGAPYAEQKRHLLHILAEHTNCFTIALVPKTARGNHSWSRGVEVEVYGLPSDQERLEMLYTSLLVQADRDLLRAAPLDPWEDLASFRITWLYGFCDGIHTRLAEIRFRAEAANNTSGTGPGTALVLADRKALAKGAAERDHPASFTHKLTGSSGTGRRAGREAAQRADLGQTRFTGGQRGELPA